MTNKDMVDALKAVLAALLFYESPDLYIDLHVRAALMDIKAALEANPPLEAPVLAEVEGWLDKEDWEGMENGVTTLFISEREDQQIGATLPVTVTIRGR